MMPDTDAPAVSEVLDLAWLHARDTLRLVPPGMSLKERVALLGAVTRFIDAALGKRTRVMHSHLAREPDDAGEPGDDADPESDPADLLG